MTTPLAQATTIQEAEATVRPAQDRRSAPSASAQGQSGAPTAPPQRCAPTASTQRGAPAARRKTLVHRLDGFDRRRGGYAPRVSEQCRQALSAGVMALSAQGLSLRDVIRVVYLVRDADAFSSCFPLLREVFGDSRPAATLRLVTGFANPEIEIEIELLVGLTDGAPSPG
jgi:2-iminobutanoate/2-iminopropanoate deaminase